MSNPTQRYRWGYQQQTRGKIAAGNKVVIGDMVGMDGAYFSDFDTLNAGTGGFHDVQAGVLIDGGTTGNETSDTLDALVGSDAVYEMDLDTAVVTARGPNWPVSAVGNQTVSLQDSLLVTEVGMFLAQGVNVGDTKCFVFIKNIARDGGPVAPG